MHTGPSINPAIVAQREGAEAFGQAFDAGFAAYRDGAPRSACPWGEVVTEFDADSDAQAGWILGWDEAQMQEHDLAAFVAGMQAEHGEPCPYRCPRLVEQWAAGWLQLAHLEAADYPEEH